MKDSAVISLLSAVFPLQLQNLVLCGRVCHSHMSQNFITLGVKGYPSWSLIQGSRWSGLIKASFTSLNQCPSQFPLGTLFTIIFTPHIRTELHWLIMKSSCRIPRQNTIHQCCVLLHMASSKMFSWGCKFELPNEYSWHCKFRDDVCVCGDDSAVWFVFEIRWWFHISYAEASLMGAAQYKGVALPVFGSRPC